jgi:2-keto-4-pentenoate hydratase
MNDSTIQRFATEILGIFRNHVLERTSDEDIQGLSLDDAYAVQEKYLAARIAAGDRAVGYKVGCTSPAIRTQFVLTEPVCGLLIAPHIYHDGERLDINDYIDCALEPELVLHIGMDLDGSNLESSYLQGAITAISPGVEVHNYRFWYGRPTHQELIASNAIHAALVVGAKYEYGSEIDLTKERTTLLINNVEVAAGFGAEIMGGPVESLRWLLTHLRKSKKALRMGDLVIPGSATKLVPVAAGDSAEARFTHFGSCRVTFE